ncbi:alpha/beta hydrolase [Pluralibacter gergoviae]|uniref:Alpha/beta hydrolase n=1 Tax=Pluralibacter gergoviae TaxID=61647 RepID=A0AAW8HRH7_PLUGE|nr:alpha/beta hydrolase [Pluralibacter gergoviae]AVR01420.1 alpha/beta hydrolase [Pluralibacter gergoviae]KMK03655.1 alpha/beta hydrolase [Pluralibacter gergoviae]KMK27457.1 alpha/beta hydrolase [Pluralibacter gergoviae]MDQ2309914.1 alpha/beta hydrolase [Pluralibacter gergoviae]SUB73631.1 Lipase 2 [Pluralibacter gergoviae]
MTLINKCSFRLASGLLLSAMAVSAGASEITGYAEGAQVMRVEKTQGRVDALNDIVYSQVKSATDVRQLHMSLLVPRNNKLKPAIVYFPGGGFTSASWHKYIAMRMALANAGFVVASAEYRTVPDTFPAPVVDGKAAVRYLREHAAEYGIDPKRIGVLGDSAGGYLAQMVALTGGEKRFEQGDYLTQSSAVQAAATLYGISDLRNIGEGFPEVVQNVHRSPAVTEALLVNGTAFRDFPGAAIGSDEKKALAASPMGHLSGKKPPFLIMHGSADTLVSPLQSQQLYNALKKAGDRADYVILAGAEHGDDTWYQTPVIERVVNWFKATLGDPQNAPAAPGAAKDKNANL